MKLISTLKAAIVLSTACATAADVDEADWVVDGDTSGGVTAAVQAKRMGKSAILVFQ